MISFIFFSIDYKLETGALKNAVREGYVLQYFIKFLKWYNFH